VRDLGRPTRARKASGQAGLARLGRLAEPVLRRVTSITTDAGVRIRPKADPVGGGQGRIG